MLRIIGGSLKRRKIYTPRDAETTRPMPERVRLSIFNLLRGHTEDVEVFDAFAGSGSMGFEALSRGATYATFIERDKKVAALIEDTAEELGLLDKCEIGVSDALGAGALARCPEGVHLIFYDPPYPLVLDPAQWPRVRDQLARFIGKLDDTGYAVFRTPLPFYHEEADAEAPAAPKRRPRRPAEDDVEIIELDAAAPPAKKRVDVDLKLPGALGPETHEYGTMAIHLYMRDPDAAGPE
ncbi:MAG: RsmD family RNA methyltransferase [Phycisphaerales bacterium JB041]